MPSSLKMNQWLQTYASWAESPQSLPQVSLIKLVLLILSSCFNGSLHIFIV